MRRPSERGQATTEYMVVVGTTLGGLSLLFLPVVGGKSIFLMMVEVFDIYVRSFLSVVSLPVP